MTPDTPPSTTHLPPWGIAPMPGEAGVDPGWVGFAVAVVVTVAFAGLLTYGARRQSTGEMVDAGQVRVSDIIGWMFIGLLGWAVIAAIVRAVWL